MADDERKKISLRELWKRLQKDQPSFLTEMRALVREGREDFLTTLMGPLAGATREPGAPGTPTPQQTTAALEGKHVYLPQDRIAEPKLSLEQMKEFAKERELEAEQRMDRGRDKGSLEMG